MRQVSKHASDETCWIVVNGKVCFLLLLLPFPSPSAPTGPSKWTRVGESYMCHPRVDMRKSTCN
jgi:hypothetical protein